MKSISIFGATGSIGCTAAKLLETQFDQFEVVTLTGGRNLVKLAELAAMLKPKFLVIQDPTDLHNFKDMLADKTIQVSAGRDALLESAEIPVDISLQAIVGFAGVETGLIAAKHCKTIALANKETLVCAGPLIKAICKENNTILLPVDSEHSAIFQCLQGENVNTVERIILTASGGPFLNLSYDQLNSVTPAQAMKHPRWEMGQRISIDSASLFNKGMEMIETHELFDVDADKIEVIVHPQSIIHSMVGFVDGAIMAHLGPTDMSGAIGYAMNYPYRTKQDLERLDFAKIARLDFLDVDHQKFPSVKLAIETMKMGGFAGAVYNASKEGALDLFLNGQINFTRMTELVAISLDNHARRQSSGAFTIENLNGIDKEVRLSLRDL